MGTPEDSPALPYIRVDQELWPYISTPEVEVDAVASLPFNELGMTLGQMGVRTIHFAAGNAPSKVDFKTGYNAEEATIRLHPMTADAPVSVRNPQIRQDRRVPEGARQNYFRERSRVLSGQLAGMLVHRMVAVGYRSEEMREEHAGYVLRRWSAFGGFTLLGAYGVYKANELGITEPTLGYIATFCGGVAVFAMAVGTGYSSLRKEEGERDVIVERYAREAYQTAPPDLVYITPSTSR